MLGYGRHMAAGKRFAKVGGEAPPSPHLFKGIPDRPEPSRPKFDDLRLAQKHASNHDCHKFQIC